MLTLFLFISNFMKILIHPMHTAYDFEFAKTGHEFFSMNGTWDTSQRPKPANWHLIGEPTGTYDVAVCVSLDMVERMSKARAPVIVNFLSDWGSGLIPEDVESKVAKVSFLGPESAAAWRMKDDSKKSIIAMGIDETLYCGYRGDKGGVLTVGGCIPKRPYEKGLQNLIDIDRRVALTLMGPVNDGLRCAYGMVSHERLVGMYREFAVYVNPGPVIGISVAEAMTAGMPVVTFRTINLKGLIQDGKNGFIVDTVDQAVDRIKMLLAEPALRSSMSAAARMTAVSWFGLMKFISEWNALFNAVRMR